MELSNGEKSILSAHQETSLQTRGENPFQEIIISNSLSVLGWDTIMLIVNFLNGEVGDRGPFGFRRETSRGLL